MQSKLDFYQRQSHLYHLLLILILTSCNTYKPISEYPNFTSINEKNSKFNADALNLFSNHKRIKDSNMGEKAPHYIEKNTKLEADALLSLVSNNQSYLNYMPLRSMPIISEANDCALTASLSSKPISKRFSSIPDTIKVINSNGIVSDTIKNIQSLTPAELSTKYSIEKKQKNATTFARISFISALLIIPSIFIIPGLFLLLIPASIVFGILGLKSPQRKKALAGIIIAVSTLLLFIIFVLAYAGLILS